MANKKSELVLITYQMLKTHSPSEIKIRNVAAEAHCTSTAIYRHFTDFDQLILFACIRFLEDYVVDLQDTIHQNSDALDMLIEMWKAFAKYAFRNVEVFDMLFWGKFREQLGDTIFDYYQLFPDKWQNMDALFASVFFNNDLSERNGIIMHRAAISGYFSYDEERMLSDMECVMFHGLLLQYRGCYRIPGKADEGAARFMEMLHSLISKYRLR